MDEETDCGDLPCEPFKFENLSEVLPDVEIKNEVMDIKDLLFQPFKLENPTDVVTVLRLNEVLQDVKVNGVFLRTADPLNLPLELEHLTELVPVMRVKEELPNVKNELIPVHDLEYSPAPFMDGCNADSVNIKLEGRSDEDPLTIEEMQSGCDSAGKASCSYMSSERTSVEVIKSELYCKRKTSNIIDLNNSALQNVGKPANCVLTECVKIGLQTLHNFGGRKYICDECKKCFTKRSNIIRHFLNQCGETKHKCQDCGKCFTCRGSLVSHSLIHSGENQLKCQDCGKSFTQRGRLVRHSLVQMQTVVSASATCVVQNDCCHFFSDHLLFSCY